MRPSRYSENMESHIQAAMLWKRHVAQVDSLKTLSSQAAGSRRVWRGLQNLGRKEKDELLCLLVHGAVLEQVTDHRNAAEAGNLANVDLLVGNQDSDQHQQ